MEGYLRGALRKELHIAPFVERFKTTLRKSITDKLFQYFEQFT